MEILNKIKKNTIIIIIMTIIVLFIVLKDDFKEIVNDLRNMDLKYIFIALVLYALYLILHSYVVYKTVNRKDKFTFKESIKHNIIVQFFNGITPFSTGGQPMEIYMLTKHDIKPAKATNYIIQNFIFYQIALVLFGMVAVIINYSLKLFPQVNIIRELVVLGFIINTLVAIILLIISFSKKLTVKMINITLKILHKLNIVKNIEKQKENWEKIVEEFNESANELKKRKLFFIIGVALNFIGLACFYAIPLFIIYALHDYTSMNLVSAITSSAYVMIIGAFVPIPGASGGIEYGFTQFFGNFLSISKTNTTLLIWRFITYYIGMILGAILFNIDKDENKKGERI